MTLDILNIVELRRKGILDVDDNDLPVGLLLVEESHHTENLDLLDLTGVADKLTNLADVERIVITLGLGLGVDNVRVLPGLFYVLVRTPSRADDGSGWFAYLGEGSVVPEVALVREAVADKPDLALLDILLNGVEELLLGDLMGLLGCGDFGAGFWTRNEPRACRWSNGESRQPCSESSSAHFTPSKSAHSNGNWDYADNVLGVERDIMPGRDGDAILLDVDAVLYVRSVRIRADGNESRERRAYRACSAERSCGWCKPWWCFQCYANDEQSVSRWNYVRNSGGSNSRRTTGRDPPRGCPMR